MDGAKRGAPSPEAVETADHPRAGFAMPSPAELSARFPGLEVAELLGHGGMGVVYRGRQTLLDRPVALKLIRPDLQADPAFRDRFLREARTLARLRHPYIVAVHDICVADGLYGLIMEYVEGTSLRQLLAGGTVGQRDVLDFVPQVAEALQHAHEAGVVHRDVKPENVLVDPRRRVRLVDFGLAALLGPGAQAPGADGRVVGTPRYMAPEQVSMPEAVDHRADIYSTGVVAYEMLTRELPGPDRVSPSRRAGTDPRLDPVVLRALEPDRDRRYPDALAMHRDIVRLARTPGSTIHLESHVPAPPGRVFAAWIDPGQWADWYAPGDDFGPTVGEADPRVGGDYRIGMLLPGRAEPRYASGQFCRVDEPRALSFTWAWEPLAPGWPETQVTVEFRARGDGTDVMLTHERFRDQADRDSHARGWRGCLDRLRRRFEG